MALAQHSEVVGMEVKRSNEAMRKIHITVIESALERASIKDAPTPEVLAFLIAAITRTIGTEEALGSSLAHAAVHTYVQNLLEQIEGKQT